ncbi:MAG: hypothetical protein P1V81_04925 [Planctomycetota bacterium]|nr:hypothetical protein [Planctomycetota bacterium]
MARNLAALAALAASALSIAIGSAWSSDDHMPTSAPAAPTSTSFEVTTVRVGTEQGLRSKTDAGVLALNAALMDVLKAGDSSTILSSVEGELVKSYGGRQVSVSPSDPRYEWVWDEERQIWTLRCKSELSLLVNDGGAQDILVRVAVIVKLP